ncbi:required for excision 1-B domain-containing protein-like [Watersipora subatra]|uniref:required for excision 1-B domain-containing protein-like n=1 Tax=Watersipora subatra TaxID=2589382 RepID=UPI00355C9C46
MENEQLDGIKRFYLLQTERVETYRLFDDGFQAYLKGAPQYNFPMYKKLVHEITTAFQKISADILTIEKMLLEHNRKDLADSIRKIQEFEERKLKLTAELQMMLQKQTDEPESEMQESINEHKNMVSEVISEINEEMDTLKYASEDLYTNMT